MSVQLENLYQIVGTLVESAPDGRPGQAAVKALAKSSQVFGPGNEAFGGRACRATRHLMGLVHICAFAHEDRIDVVVVKLAVFGTTVACIGDGDARVGPHALSKALKSWGIKRLFIGLADEVLSGDHNALTVNGHLKGGAKFGLGMALALLDGTGIEGIE